MKLKFFNTAFAALMLAVTLVGNVANAGLIKGNLNVDNDHSVFLSTDDNVQGDLISVGVDNWKVTDTFSKDLVAGTDYFLHIYASDRGVVAGFLGDFTLEGNKHVFSNGLTEILTNTVDWKVATDGWINYSNVGMSDGKNGEGKWGEIAGVDSNATWIWSDDGCINCQRYFSLAISATTAAEQIPEPSTIAIFALAMIGLASRRLKKQS